MYNILVVGGSSGLGASIVKDYINECDCRTIYIIDRVEPSVFSAKIEFLKQDLSKFCISILDDIEDIDKLFITAGYGKLAYFQDNDDYEIRRIFEVNTISLIRILRYYYDCMLTKPNFETVVISSIAAHVVSPLFSLYSASKAALSKCIEAMNVELIKQNSKNRILEVSPGKIEGTSFYGKATDLEQITSLTKEIRMKSKNSDMLYIPNYETYKRVIERNNENMYEFGLSSYDYKITNSKLKPERQYVIGYLSGTFDLFHIGHLNLLKRAKEQCDYLIVGVHESGKWKGKETFIPFEERLQIVQSNQFVDRAVMSCKEDSEAWEKYHYDKLFVGSDYKGSERFNRYEQYFSNKNVEIIYFPYTKGTSSTQLREALAKK